MHDKIVRNSTILLNYNSLQNIKFTKENRKSKFYINLELKGTKRRSFILFSRQKSSNSIQYKIKYAIRKDQCKIKYAITKRVTSNWTTLDVMSLLKSASNNVYLKILCT